ncbi:universal stress protein [Rhodococcus sp. Eu-32]|uniref:universal stress protein n=1 Tax=Rhodococcus sp. Eu-32 TaxID=1017319 RepID=UPI000DF451A4|nr:universal stress protein [Rhodococcus sp. Eu-32]RRQ27180.1 universal stress protein [Rhodococcus sp. Eu-32]
MDESTNDAMPIYVGIDGSVPALEAARWAGEYAARIRRSVVLVHSLPDVTWYLGTGVLAGEQEILGELREVGRQALDAAERAVREVNPSIDLRAVQTRKSVTDYFESVSDDAHVIVVGSRRSSALTDLVLGGEVIRVCNSVECPVLVWRAHSADDADADMPVVVGVDGTESSNHALRAAFEFADTVKAPVIATHAWQIAESVGVGYAAGLIDWDRLRSDQRQWLRDTVNPIADSFADVAVTCASVEGQAAHHLRTLSASAQLVVVGSRGRGKMAGALLGSVSQNMIHHAQCPVLVVH